MKPYVQYISMGHISHSPKMILGEVKRGFKTGRLQHFCICKSSTGLRCHLYGVALEVHFATAAQRWNSLFSSSSSLQPFAHNAPPPTRQASCNRDGRLTLECKSLIAAPRLIPNMAYFGTLLLNCCSAARELVPFLAIWKTLYFCMLTCYLQAFWSFSQFHPLCEPPLIINARLKRHLNRKKNHQA